MKKNFHYLALKMRMVFYQFKIICSDRLLFKTFCRLYFSKIFFSTSFHKQRRLILEHIRQICPDIPYAFICQDLQGLIVDLNDPALALIGARSKRDVIGKRLCEFYPKLVSEQFSLDFALVLRNLRDIKREYVLEDKKINQIKSFIVSTFPLTDSNRKAFGVVSTIAAIDVEKK